MGEAKKRGTRPALTEAERAAMLGDNFFTTAYEFLFGMVERMYVDAGGVANELIGIDFDSGKVCGVNVLLVRRTEDVPHLRDQMLEKWPMVAHVFEAWAAPDTSVPPSQHPLRYDVVSVVLHVSDMVAAGMCRVDPGSRTIERGELLHPTEVRGRLGRDLPPPPGALV